ncbi:MAG TPA: exosortase F system-associated protein, partial [Salinimicrobium sp.]|nr:exosortase F system-associated protein [Salinimicrobium sp.]
VDYMGTNLFQTKPGMKKYWKIPALIGLTGLLVLVRVFEKDLFFDDYINFFDSIYSIEKSGVFQWKLFFNISARYLLNSLISLLILYVAFQRTGIIKFAGLLYAVLFIILLPLFFYLRSVLQYDEYLALFYVRRFLVHPLFIIILLPAFYYQSLKK